MSVPSDLLAAFMATAAFATPTKLVARQHGPDGCADINSGEHRDESYIPEVRYFSDDQCSNLIGHDCYYSLPDTPSQGSGGAACAPENLPDGTPYYAMIVDTAYPSVELVFTNDQTCPPSGPGAVFASLVDNSRCVEFNQGGSTPGMTTYQNGGSGLAKKRQSNPNCSGFNIESQQTSESNSVQISDTVDCTNSGSDGCSIMTGMEHTETVTTSFPRSAGGNVEGIDIGATFGMEYSSSESSSIQLAVIPVNPSRPARPSCCTATASPTRLSTPAVRKV